MDRNFRLNQVVSVPSSEAPDYGVGRVWYHDKSTCSVYVLIKTGNYCWRVKKFDELEVAHARDCPLWTLQRPFGCSLLMS